ncbi:MAG: hypothetical protein WA707_08260 [Pseudolabrys sp.]
MQSLANVHSLFVQTRWVGAERPSIARFRPSGVSD